jgi:membrane protease YdiL (CAAX protease family)
MAALDQPDTHFRPLPEVGLGAPEHGPGRGRFPVGARGALLGLLVAVGATLALVVVLAIAYTAAGVENLDDSKSFGFVATLAGDFALVSAAWLMVGEGRRISLETFGVRRFKPSAIGWVLLAFAVYLTLAAIYSVLVNPPPDKLPDELGAKDSTLLAVLTGVFVIAVAPLAEEFFFRGFLFQALRNSWGPVFGALSSAVIFSAIHAEPDKFVQLAILGTALAFVFNKTDSLWPCIMLHALNNTLAFAVTV